MAKTMLEFRPRRNNGESSDPLPATSAAQQTLAQKTLVELIERQVTEDGRVASKWPGLSFYRTSRPAPPQPVVYKPCLCLVAQGSKRAHLGDRVYVYDSMRYLVLSVPLPVKAGVTEASPEKPFLSLVFEIDTSTISELLLEVAEHDASPNPGAGARGVSGIGVSGMYVSRIDEDLTGAVIRLLQVLDDPTDLSVLGPQYSREILYRVLRGEQGHLLRTAALAASRSHQVAQVIRFMEAHYEQPLDIPTLAREAGMSTSSLHHTFKDVTSMSPLQYLKQIRLHRARLMMLEQGSGAGEAAYQVGYGSPSQFSREFKRLFGQSPRQEVQQFRELQASP